MGKAKEPKRYNFRVEVEIDRRYEYRQPDDKELKNRCDELAKSIKRHCDDVGSAMTICDYEYQCEHCGAEWTEKSDVYNGGCCDKDELSNPDATA